MSDDIAIEIIVTETAIEVPPNEPIVFEISTGQDGAPGVGLPPGGSVGQIPTKVSDDDYDIAWQTPTAYIPLAEKGAPNGVATLGVDGKLTNAQVPSYLLGSLNFVAIWNANTNSPAIVSGVGVKGNYYIVGTAGATNIDGETDWKAKDWIVFNGATWDKIDNTDLVTAVNGQVGNVVLGTDQVSEGVSNLYFTATRAVNSVLTGLSLLTGTAVVATDSILIAIGKLQKQITDLVAVVALKASVSLSNLASTAVNVSLIPAVNNTIDLGTSILRWRNIYAQQLRNSSTSTPVVDLVNYNTRDGSGNISIQFASQRALLDSTQGSSLEWENRKLFSTAGQTLDWQNGITYYSASYGGNLFLSWQEGVLYDPEANPAIDVGNRVIQWPHSGPAMLNFYDGTMFDSSGNYLFQLDSRVLNGSLGEVSIDFNSKYLADADEVPSVDWGQRLLLGPGSEVLVDYSDSVGPKVPTQFGGDSSNYAASTQFVQSLATQILTALTASIALKQDNVGVATNWAMYDVIPSGAFSVYGHAPAVTEVGAAARGILGSTSAYARASRRAYATSASAGSAAGARQSASCFFTTSPFDVLMEFGTETPGLTGIRAFYGWSASVAAPSNIDYTSLINVIGIARIAGSDNFHLITNDATGTATAINLGVNFPANTNFVDQYTLRLRTTTANGTVTYTVTRYPSTGGAPIVSTGTISTDLPAANSAMRWQAQVNNNTQATAVSITLSTVKLQWNK